MPTEAPVSLAVAESMGLAIAIASAAVAWYLFTKVNDLPGKLDEKLENKLADIWQAITLNDKATQQFRERMLERLSDVPTNAALVAMETRIMNALNGRPFHAGD
jgi:hypothetical protein